MKYTLKSTDAELLEGCRNRHPLAQKYLYQRYFGQMIGICMRYTSNRCEAEEVLNQAFLKVFQNLHQYRGTGALGGWIAQIVFRTSIDFVRSHITYRKVIDFQSTYEGVIQNPALDNLAAEEILRLLQKIPRAAKTVFNLYVIEGYKHHEIADILGISEGTSKWHLSEARKHLKKLLKRQIPSIVANELGNK
ncbi:MAG: RNA polymerase sigma factor [Bacteroidota bacterium]